MERNVNPMEKTTMAHEVHAVRLADGLGFGHGPISPTERHDNPEDTFDRHVTDPVVEAAIESDKILVPVDLDDNDQPIEDDGCGDGRRAKTILQKTKEGVTKTFKRSLHRAKVFGGGLTMAVAAEIGKDNDEPLDDMFSNTIEVIKKRRISFGAHTDESAHGEKCGCGAIDKAPEIIHNATQYETEIRGAVTALTGASDDTKTQEKLNNIFATFGRYSHAHKDEAYSGKKVSDTIANSGKVIKELEGAHLETHIVINMTKGYTVDQEYIREVSDGKAQVFAVDAWRLLQIAEGLYDDSSTQQVAYLSMLVYTLATAATLTKGDLPVYIVSRSNELTPAA